MPSLTVALLSVASVSAAVGCWSASEPLPRDAESFEPPAIYARWWAMTESCSGISGNLATVQWYRAPAVTLNGDKVAGIWRARGQQIVLAEGYVDAGAAVRHEMLHALLRTEGHPRSQFLEACAEVVDCPGCKDVEPWHAPQPSFLVLPPDSFDVTSKARLLPNENDGQRWLALEMWAQNPRAAAAIVAPPGEATTAPAFGYDLRGPQGGILGNQVATDSSMLFFAPFETKHWLYEFRVASDLSEQHVTVGEYLVRGSYARRYSTYDTIVVTP